MNTIKTRLLRIFIFAIAFAVFFPVFASAVSQDEKRLEAAKEELRSFEEQVIKLKIKKVNGEKKRVIELLEDEIQTTKLKISELETISKQPPSEIKITRTLKLGITGVDVKQLQEFLSKRPDIYPKGLATGYFGPLTEAAVKKYQEKHGIEQAGIVGPKTREKLNSEFALGEAPAPSVKVKISLPIKEIKNEASRGASGKDVRELQETLRNFPEVYPQGLATGFFDPDTEGAVKNLQLKFGLEQTGKFDAKTKENLNSILHAIEKKKPPKISDVTPESGRAGITIALTGKGFTPEDNAIFVRGQTVLKNLVSTEGGTSISFVMPSDMYVVCPAGPASQKPCPIKVINANGISNARPFKLANIPLPPQIDPAIPPEPTPTPTPTPEPTPEPTPTPVPTPPPPPPPAPVILNLDPPKGTTGTNVKVIGSGFTATGNAVNFAGTAISNLSSFDGSTLNFTVPSTSSCQIGRTCSVSVSNANGASNSVSFLLVQAITPVIVSVPNGGETYVQGLKYTLSWSGGTDRVQILLVSETATSGSDPTEFIVGWIATSTAPSGSVIWDARSVCTLDGICVKIDPGNYKILALSEDELGFLTLWDDIANQAGNWDVSDKPFTVHPEASITLYIPNGGEYYTVGYQLILCWDTFNILSKKVTVELWKAGKFYRTIFQDYELAAGTGSYANRWIIPADVESGSDYQVKIYDPTLSQVYDMSDMFFTIRTIPSSIRLYYPNGGEKWVQEFKGQIYWYGYNLPSQAVNINLLKGGVFFKNLATNLPQKYSWSDQIYSSGGFWHYATVTPEMAVGNDYQIEVTDAASTTIRDVSDAVFSVVALPEKITTTVRVLDYHTNTPFANQSSWVYDAGRGKIVITNQNGELSVTATTSDIVKGYYSGFYLQPTCFEYKSIGVHRDTYGLYTYVNIFPFIGSSRYYRVYSGDNNVGDTPFWQMTNLQLNSEIPARSSLYYRDKETGKAINWYSTGSSFTSTARYWNALPSALDVWTRIEDLAGNMMYSPYKHIPVGACPDQQVLSVTDATPRWEPYTITVSPPSFYNVVDRGVKVNGSASGGVTPYDWNVSFGSLPPDLSLSPSGTLSGTTTQAGFFSSTLKVKDAKGVSNMVDFSPLVYNKDWTIPPTIRVGWPNPRLQIYQGGGIGIQWYNYNIPSKKVVIDLLKDGVLYRNINTGFTMTATSSYGYYYWQMPIDIPEGLGYAIRISDALDSSVFGLVDQMQIVSGIGTSWYRSSLYTWTGYSYTATPAYSQYLSFRYATSSLPNIEGLKLYEKRPGDTGYNLAASFIDPSLCLAFKGGLKSGVWTLRFYCTSGTDIWSIQRDYAPLSSYPAGAYEYYVTTVDHYGVESAPIARLRQHALERVAILSPTSAESPVATLNPLIRWTVPKDWPSIMDKYFMIYIRDAITNAQVSYTGTLVGPWDEVGYRKYESVAPWYPQKELDPTKKYTAEVEGSTSIFDSSLLSWVSYIAMSAATSTFWFEQYTPPPPVSVITESLPAAMVSTSYNTALSATGGAIPYRWSLVSGALPTGFILYADGRIYGWPSQQGIFKFRVQVTDALGGTATKDLSIEVKPEIGAYWSGGWGINPLYIQYLRFGYTKPADVTALKLYQKVPGETSFKIAGTFSGISETCGANYSPVDSLWRLYFFCGTSYRYWQANLKSSYAASYFPVGEYDYYLTAVGSDGTEANITPVIKQFALDRITIMSPTEAQSPTVAAPKFEWTVAQTGWPSGITQPYYIIAVFPEGSYSYTYYKWTYGKVGVPTASYIYDGATPLDPAKKYIANILNYGQTVLDPASFTKTSYISMLDAVSRFWIAP